MNALPHSVVRFALVTLLFLRASTGHAEDREDRIRALEQRVEQLERLLRQSTPTSAPPVTAGTGAAEVPTAVSTPASGPKPGPGPSLSVGASGFTMRSADTNFVLRLRGLLQVDSRSFLEGSVAEENDAILIRRARTIFEGTVYRDFDFLFTPEFAGSSVALRDAWLNYSYADGVQLRAGKMKSPGSLDRWQSASAIPLIERSLVSGLWPTRELGFMVHGELWPGAEEVTKSLATKGLFHYALGVFSGTADGRAAGNADVDDNRSVGGRLFFHPFLRSDVASLRGIGLGLAASYGREEGANGLPDDRGYATESDLGFFSYLGGAGTNDATANVIADGPHWRLGPQAYWFAGPFGLMGEYTVSSQRLERQAGAVDSLDASHRAWALTASWLLTGEDAAFRLITPRRSFDPRAGGWGAWQVVVRYSELDIDDDVFPGYADPAESATEVNSIGAGLNWFLNRNVRTAVVFNHSNFKGGSSGVSGGRDVNAIQTRVQLVF